VIIPTYNRAHCVGDAIRSVLAQSLPPFEIIVVDDGSSDDTPRVLASFGDSIRALRQENAGVSAARNRGIEAARGEWISFLDSDDLWSPEKMSRSFAILKEHPEAIAVATNGVLEAAQETVNIRDLRGSDLADGLVPRPLVHVVKSMFWIQGLTVAAPVAKRLPRFDTAKRAHEDIEWIARCALEGAFCFLSAPMFSVRRLSEATVALSALDVTDRRRWLETLVSVYRGLLASESLTRNERALLRRQLAGALLDLAGVCRQAGSRRASWNCIWEAAQVRPSPVVVVRALALITSLHSHYDAIRGGGGYRRPTMLTDDPA
jgi:glycosyltransferase involved in cell wall biosynthesis